MTKLSYVDYNIIYLVCGVIIYVIVVVICAIVVICVIVIYVIVVVMCDIAAVVICLIVVTWIFSCLAGITLIGLFHFCGHSLPTNLLECLCILQVTAEL